MHRHDLDLIAAYADGSASPGEAEAAARLVAECAECAAEHALQVEVLVIMESAPPVSMSDIERADLHRRLQTALPVQKVGWFTRYAPRVAAVAAGFAVVGLATVSMVSDGRFADQAETEDTVAASLDGSNDAGAEMGSLQEAPAEEGLLQSVDYAADDASPPAAAVEEMATDATMSDETVSTERAATLPSLATADLEGLTVTPIDELIELYGERLEDDVSICAEAIADPASIVVSFDALFEDARSSVYVYRDDGKLTAVALSIETCEVLAEAVSGP